MSLFINVHTFDNIPTSQVYLAVTKIEGNKGITEKNHESIAAKI